MAARMTDAEKVLSETWHEHIAAEFAAHSPDAAIHTMTDTPRVNQIPVMIGGDGREQVCDFYSKHFLHQIPPDWEMASVSRTIGQGRRYVSRMPPFKAGPGNILLIGPGNV